MSWGPVAKGRTHSNRGCSGARAAGPDRLPVPAPPGGRPRAAARSPTAENLNYRARRVACRAHHAPLRAARYTGRAEGRIRSAERTGTGTGAGERDSAKKSESAWDKKVGIVKICKKCQCRATPVSRASGHPRLTVTHFHSRSRASSMPHRLNLATSPRHLLDSDRPIAHAWSCGRSGA